MGAQRDSDTILGSNHGSPYVFDKPPGGWMNMTETAKLTASDAAFQDGFGISVSLSGDTALVGALADDDAGTDSGSAYVFSVSGPCPTVIPYGCGVNPAGSLTLLSGVPSLGTTVTLGVDNPLGTQAPGSLPFLALTTAPDPAFPCGTLVPGFGMGGAGAAGELLISVTPPPFLVLSGAPWAGPGTPAPIPLPIPVDTTILGASFYAQGLLVDTSPGATVSFGLTDAVELRVGP